jgi:hypothetical protein
MRIEKAPRDVEARLLLVTLLRHTRRLDQARLQLSDMTRYDEALEWEFEVDRERQLIELIERHEAAEQLIDPDEEDVLPTNNDGFIREVDKKQEHEQAM